MAYNLQMLALAQVLPIRTKVTDRGTFLPPKSDYPFRGPARGTAAYKAVANFQKSGLNLRGPSIMLTLDRGFCFLLFISEKNKPYFLLFTALNVEN